MCPTFDDSSIPSASGTLLVTEPPGYRLAVDADQVDSTRFESLAGAARDHLRSGSPADALDAANAALALWRGPALVEFRDDGFADASIARLEELRHACEEDRAAAMLELGLHATAVAELEAAVRSQPLRERRWALLITALYGAGRSADALDRYQQLRTTLLEELGLDPSPELQSLERAVLEHDESVLAVPAPVAVTPTGSRAPDPERSTLLERAVELDELDRAIDDVVDGAAPASWSSRARRAWARPPSPRTPPLGHDAAASPWRGAAATRTATRPRCGRGPRSCAGSAWPRCRWATAPTPSPCSTPTPRRSWRRRARGPIACLVEDIHWADPSTLRLLAFLAVELRDVPVLLLVTARPDEQPAAVGPAVAALLRHSGAVHLRLQPLSAGGTSALARAVAGDRLGGADTARLHDRTGGNPLFVTELARLLAAEGPDAGVPAGVREVIARRLRRLPQEANALLSLAAVGGADVDLGLVSRACGCRPRPCGGPARRRARRRPAASRHRSGAARLRPRPGAGDRPGFAQRPASPAAPRPPRRHARRPRRSRHVRRPTSGPTTPSRACPTCRRRRRGPRPRPPPPTPTPASPSTPPRSGGAPRWRCTTARPSWLPTSRPAGACCSRWPARRAGKAPTTTRSTSSSRRWRSRTNAATPGSRSRPPRR